MRKTFIFAILIAAVTACNSQKNEPDEVPVESWKASFTAEAINSSYSGGSSTLTIYKNETIAFNNTSDQADSYSWDFGDGTTSKEKSPTHQFKSCGSYYVKLTIYKGTQQAETGQYIMVTSSTIEVSTISAICTKYEYLSTAKLINGKSYHHAYTLELTGGYYGYRQASKWGMYIGTTYSYWDASRDGESILSTIWYSTTALQYDLYQSKYLKLKVKAYAVRNSNVSGDVFGEEMYVLWNTK